VQDMLAPAQPLGDLHHLRVNLPCNGRGWKFREGVIVGEYSSVLPEPWRMADGERLFEVEDFDRSHTLVNGPSAHREACSDALDPAVFALCMVSAGGQWSCWPPERRKIATSPVSRSSNGIKY
jgi:hypothetical protein